MTCDNTETISTLILFANIESNQGATVASGVELAAPLELRVPHRTFREVFVAMLFELVGKRLDGVEDGGIGGHEFAIGLCVVLGLDGGIDRSRCLS